ncbi:HAMP domain-containing protein, partial [Aquamicrobium sp. LC103]
MGEGRSRRLQLLRAGQSNRLGGMVVKFSNLKTSRKLGVAFFAVVATILAMSAAILWNLQGTKRTQEEQTVASHAFTLVHEVAYSLLQQENSYRGFLLTNDQHYVELVKTHRKKFDEQVAELLQLESGDTDFTMDISVATAAMDAWWQDIFEQGQRLAADPIYRFRAVEMVGQNGLAEMYMNSIDDALDTVQAKLQAQIDGARQAADDAVKFNETVLYVGLGFSVLISLGLGFLLSRMIAAPVTALTGVMGRLAGGDNSVVVPAVLRRDEIGEMARAVEVFKQAALAKLRAEAEAA